MKQRTKRFLMSGGIIAIGTVAYSIWKKYLKDIKKVGAIQKEEPKNINVINEKDEKNVATQQYIERRRQFAKERREKRRHMDKERKNGSDVERTPALTVEESHETLLEEKDLIQTEKAEVFVEEDTLEQIGTDEK